MPEDYVHKIVALAQPLRPVEQPSPADWEAVERDLGYAFPVDFKSLVTLLGNGSFGSGLGLNNPISSSEYCRLSKEALVKYHELVSFIEERAGIRLFPHRDGLVWIGGWERQHLLLRPLGNGCLGSDVVRLDHDYDEASDLGMPVSQFIHDLYHGRIEEQWALELRAAIWREGEVPFFSPWPQREGAGL
jgi:hypothetical protein